MSVNPMTSKVVIHLFNDGLMIVTINDKGWWSDYKIIKCEKNMMGEAQNIITDFYHRNKQNVILNEYPFSLNTFTQDNYAADF